jgi:hypothetical protein
MRRLSGLRFAPSRLRSREKSCGRQSRPERGSAATPPKEAREHIRDLDKAERIQECRETKSILGMESDLLHLTDDDVAFVTAQWRTLHPVIERDDDRLGLESDANWVSGMKEDAARRRAAVAAIAARLSAGALAEVETMYYCQINRVFVESHEAETASTMKEHALANDPKGKILHLMEKTNFLICIQGAARRLGRLALAERLRTV